MRRKLYPPGIRANQGVLDTINQEELITERESRGVYNVRPGITGLAQVNKIDMSTPVLLAKTDDKMIATLTISYYFKYILQTVTGSGSGDGVTKD